eukprot:1420223-Amphidinium_carterae.1
MHLICIAHKIHACADKGWALTRTSLTGVTRTLLVLQQASHVAKLISALKSLIPQWCRRLPATHILDSEAIEFRNNTLSTWLGPSSGLRPRKKAIVIAIAGTVLNGNWKVSGQLQHICHGCCENEQDTIELMQRWLPKLLRTLRGQALCRGNWLHWPTPLCLVGILTAAHDLLPALFTSAFGTDTQARTKNQKLQGKFE